MDDKPKKDSPEEQPDKKTFADIDIRVNEFGEIVRNFDLDALNKHLNDQEQNAADKDDPQKT